MASLYIIQADTTIRIIIAVKVLSKDGGTAKIMPLVLIFARVILSAADTPTEVMLKSGRGSVVSMMIKASQAGVALGQTETGSLLLGLAGI